MEVSQQEKEDVLAEFVNGVQASMKVIERYETSRPGSMTFTKLEEAILWAQVMIGQTKLKCVDPKPEVKEGELITNA